MTYKMHETEYEGFPIQYPVNLVQRLNEVINDTNNTNNADLEEIGKATNHQTKHRLHGKTTDGYTWFGRLIIPIKGAELAILFPWHQDFGNPTSQLDRSINVYSDKPVEDEQIKDVLEQVGYQTALKVGFKRLHF